MTSTIDLKFDDQVVNVNLAEKYLLKNNKKFRSKGYVDNGIIENDICKNQIYLSDIKSKVIGNNKTNNLEENLLKYVELAEKITQNIDLFCQLEYMLRKKPVDEVKNFDIKLLEQNLMYQSSFRTAEKAYISEIVMTADTPLASLGCIAQTLAPQITILSTKETAVICSLFADLCHEAGLDYIDLVFISNPKPKTPCLCIDLSKIKELRTGCVGIVTEKADIDSAVDTFLYATSQYPWHFKKIFVQECALNRFKRSLEWKTKNTPVDVEEYLLRSCTSVYAYGDKLYLFEFAGDVKNITQNSIVIEAYRTIKELMSIMAVIKPFCVSLWSSHVSESNEIAFGLETNIVWTNDYGCFEGSPIISQAFYSLLHRHSDTEKLQFDLHLPLSYVSKVRETWLKSKISTRLNKMSKVADKYKSYFKDVNCVRLNSSNNSDISVGNKLCIAMRRPVGVVVVKIKTCSDILQLVDYIVDGGAVILVKTDDSEIDEITKLCQALKDIDAPVVLLDDDCKLDEMNYNQLKYNTKVIWSSIGTIFAN